MNTAIQPTGAAIPADPQASLDDEPIKFSDLRLALEQAAFRVECLALLLEDLNQEIFQNEKHLSDRVTAVVHAMEDMRHSLCDPTARLALDVKERLLSLDK